MLKAMSTVGLDVMDTAGDAVVDVGLSPRCYG